MVAYTHYRTDARPRRTAETLVARGDKVHFLALAEEETAQIETINGVELESTWSRNEIQMEPQLGIN